MNHPPPPPSPPQPGEGPVTSVAVRVGGIGLIVGGLLIVALVITLPAYSYVGGSTGETYSWRWLDTFEGKGNDIAPVGAVALAVSALAAILGGIFGMAAGRRSLGFVGAVVGLIAGFVTFVCGLVFVIMLVIDEDLDRGSFGVWGLFPTGLWCLAFGIVAFIGGLKQHRAKPASVARPPMPPGSPVAPPPSHR